MPEETQLASMEFRVHKLTVRPRPADRRNICIFPVFSEFGCEIVAVLYCLPKLLREKYQGKYSIVLGWPGREYLYRHLVDEFWELDDRYQWLRDWSRAFHHVSTNLRQLETLAKDYGQLVPIDELGAIATMPRLSECMRETCRAPIKQRKRGQVCSACGQVYPVVGFFANIQAMRQTATWLPAPSQEKTARVQSSYLRPRSVGITARARRTYGRNLPAIFYERLLFLVEDLGYHPIWFGEPSTSLPCPLSRITDYSVTEDAKDLETTLALVSQLAFTIQFWTASSRLAGLVGTPYILFESPDQLYGQGQEGQRINLCTQGPHKLVISHFRPTLEQPDAALALVKKAILEVDKGDFTDIIGLVESHAHVALLRSRNLVRVGDF